MYLAKVTDTGKRKSTSATATGSRRAAQRAYSELVTRVAYPLGTPGAAATARASLMRRAANAQEMRRMPKR
jgi:hypothetical protein